MNEKLRRLLVRIEESLQRPRESLPSPLPGWRDPSTYQTERQDPANDVFREMAETWAETPGK